MRTAVAFFAALALTAATCAAQVSPSPITGSGHSPSRTEARAEPMLATMGNPARPDAPVSHMVTTWTSQFGEHTVDTVSKPNDKPGELASRHIAELREAQKTLAPIAPAPGSGH